MECFGHVASCRITTSEHCLRRERTRRASAAHDPPRLRSCPRALPSCPSALAAETFDVRSAHPWRRDGRTLGRLASASRPLSAQLVLSAAPRTLRVRSSGSLRRRALLLSPSLLRRTRGRPCSRGKAAGYGGLRLRRFSACRRSRRATSLSNRPFALRGLSSGRTSRYTSSEASFRGTSSADGVAAEEGTDVPRRPHPP